MPENSLAAFAAAAAAGYGIELDVRLSADGVAMVFHDAKLERLTGLAGPMAARSRRELAGARLAGTDQPIPTLAEALDLVAGRVPVLVEVKNEADEAGPLEEAARSALEAYAGDYGVLAFNPLTLAWFRRQAPAVPRGLNTADTDWVPQPFAVARRVAEPDFISHHLDSLSAARAKAVRDDGLPLIVYTVRGPAERAKAEALADNYIFEGFRP